MKFLLIAFNLIGGVKMTNREILEFAAKAGGIDLDAIAKKYDCDWMDIWDPFHNRICAFDLIVACGMELVIDNEYGFSSAEKTGDIFSRRSEAHGYNPNDATLRAITMCAAEIGMDMK